MKEMYKMNARLFCKTLATLGPVGLLPAPGTCASLITVPCAYLMARTGFYDFFVITFSVVAYFIIRCALPLFVRKDPQEIVLDEVVGCLWVLYAAQWQWGYVIPVVVLFRIFDITKIMGVRLFERLPGAAGVIADDCAAALLTFGVLYLCRFVW